MKFWLCNHIHFIVFSCFFSIITIPVQGNPAVTIYTEIIAPGISWQEARDSAISLGGHLVTFTSAAKEQDIIESVVSGVWWIGATDSLNEGDWQWVTGEPWGFTHWIEGEPNNFSNEDYAIWFAASNRGWADVNGYSVAGFILETNPSGPYPKHLRIYDSVGVAVTSPTPTISWEYIGSSSPQAMYEIEIGTDSNWTSAEIWDTGPIVSGDTAVAYTGSPLAEQPYYLRIRLNDGIEWGTWNQRSFYVFPANKHFYEFVLPVKTWEQAKDSALRAGGHLATITNVGERPIDSLLYGGLLQYNNGGELVRSYIGGHFQFDTLEQWGWLNSEAWEYTNWDFGQPNFPDSVLTLEFPNKWLAENGEYALPFIIEYDTDWGVTDAAIDNLSIVNRHTTSHNPLFSWKVSLDTIPVIQYQVQVSKSANWATPTSWDSGPIAASDTQTLYAGSPLADGTIYFVRTRVFNIARSWTPWKTSIFLTAYPPTPPIVDTQLATTAASEPILTVANSIDAAGSGLKYRFEIYRDNLLTQLQDSASNILQDFGWTSWQVTTILQENTYYWWRCQAYNTNEVSEWSLTGRLYIKKAEHAPTIPHIQLANDTTLFEMLPTVHWLASTDIDPNDTIHYRVEIYKLPLYTPILMTDSILTASYTLTDSLDFDSEYALYVYAIDHTSLNSLDLKFFRTWTLGDANNTHSLNIMDLNYLIQYFFSGGSPTEPIQTGDINGDCQINILDIVYMISYLFQSGLAPKVGCVP